MGMAPWLTLAALSLVALPAAAHPNTPLPVYGEVPCMVTVDKAVEPRFDLGFSIPKSPFGPIDDKSPLLDNHTVQFFGFNRQIQDRLSNWITQDDLDRVAGHGIIDPSPVTDDDILELSSYWEPDEWVRVTPDDDRLPLDPDENARVLWDTTDVEPGTYVIASYSWEPPTNLWLQRYGAIRVIADAADPSTIGPSVFLAVDIGASAKAGEDYPVRGCSEGMEGTTIELQWLDRTVTDDLQWEAFATVDAGGVLEGSLPTSADLVGHLLGVRAVATDPMGREYIAYAPVSVDVQSGGGAPSDGGGSDDASGSDGGAMSSSSDDGLPGSSDGGETSGGDAAPAENDDSAGCSCAQSGPRPALAWLWLLAIFVRRRHPTWG